MIENIVLMTWNPDAPDASGRITIQAAYPDEQDEFDKLEIDQKIFQAHQMVLEKQRSPGMFTDDYLHSNMKALTVDGKNILSVVLPHNNILGLVFPKEENPYDYRNELIRLLLEYFLQRFLESEKDKVKQTLLLTLFVDLRKYGDDVLTQQEEQNRVMIIGNTPMIKVFVFGIDNAGKSSLMRFLATGKFENNYFPPTKKFRITNIKLNSGVKLVAWDMPGQRIFRAEWIRGAQASNILLFVLDTADYTRFDEAKQELINMLDLYELQGIPLLFLANKTDLTDAHSDPKEIAEKFNLDFADHREVKLIFSSIKNNLGIDDAVKWIESKVEKLLVGSNIKISDATSE